MQSCGSGVRQSSVGHRRGNTPSSAWQLNACKTHQIVSEHLPKCILPSQTPFQTASAFLPPEAFFAAHVLSSWYVWDPCTLPKFRWRAVAWAKMYSDKQSLWHWTRQQGSLPVRASPLSCPVRRQTPHLQREGGATTERIPSSVCEFPGCSYLLAGAVWYPTRGSIPYKSTSPDDYRVLPAAN